MSESLRVSLSAWMIQDGNYGDFAVGETRAFALEFWSSSPLIVRHPDAIDMPLSLTWMRDCTYAMKGRVVFEGAGWWVLDVGVLLYQDKGQAPGPVGTPVRGEIGVGIDHFSYFERLSKAPDAPPLIHDWRIDAIECDATPYVELKPKYFERDRTREAWKAVRRTNAWKDDGGDGSYLLTCKRVSAEARHER